MPEDQARAPAPGAAELVEERATWAKHDCARCLYWRPGVVVLRGSTLGECKFGQGRTAADDSCDDWVLDQ